VSTRTFCAVAWAKTWARRINSSTRSTVSTNSCSSDMSCFACTAGAPVDCGHGMRSKCGADSFT
jgi:hypothetical protein